MNIRDEAVLRELNLYPLWVRRGTPATVESAPVTSDPAMESHAVAPVPDEVISKPTEGHADTRQSATGYAEPVLSPDEGLGPSGIGHLSWSELKHKVHDCSACKLRAGCSQTVFGVGDENADWLFVGEGPGADEDAQGEPFVGQAGKLLDNMLAAIKLKRGSNVYIANIVKCRPPGNRTPESDEIATCLPYLQQQIALIKPKLIVALGKTAATSLLMEPLATGGSSLPAKSQLIGRDATLGSLRGTIHDCHGTPLIVTYHPAYLLRSPAEKAKAWQDLCFAQQRMMT